MTTDKNNDTTAADSQNASKTDAGNAPRKYWLTLLKAARLIEAHSHYDEPANEYHIDPHAMAHLCAAIGNRKLSKLTT